MAKNLLDLDGKELQRELDRIIAANPPRYKPWTAKELQILEKLRLGGVPSKKIAETLGRNVTSIDNKLKRIEFG